MLGLGAQRKIRTMAGCASILRSSGIQPATVIDVGVARGTYELYDAFPDVPLLLVEPMEEFRPALEAVCLERRGEFVIAAAGAAAGKIELSFGERWDGASSTIAFANKRTVPLVRLDDVVAERGLKGPYLLKIDVQGAERSVLDGAATVLGQACAVLLEVGLYDFGGTGFDLAAAVDYMAGRGFKAFDLYDGMSLGSGALAQIDIAFVPADASVRERPQWLTPQQDKRREMMGRLRNLLGV
jgi:FkbM family methyltransferase